MEVKPTSGEGRTKVAFRHHQQQHRLLRSASGYLTLPSRQQQQQQQRMLPALVSEDEDSAEAKEVDANTNGRKIIPNGKFINKSEGNLCKKVLGPYKLIQPQYFPEPGSTRKKIKDESFQLG